MFSKRRSRESCFKTPNARRSSQRPGVPFFCFVCSHTPLGGARPMNPWGACFAVAWWRAPARFTGRMGDREVREARFLGFALPPARPTGPRRGPQVLLLARGKYFWLWSSKDKNAFSPSRTSRPPILPVKKSRAAQRGPDSARQLLRFELRVGSPKPLKEPLLDRDWSGWRRAADAGAEERFDQRLHDGLRVFGGGVDVGYGGGA
jgi:hypothetical protein